MPLFEFDCIECGEPFEKLVRNSSKEITCPVCGSVHVKKKISTFASRVAGGSSSLSSGAVAAPSCSTGGL
ncbi:MAG: zinc ribbon domain-containing protein [Anaerolineaceae bacterium]|nr:zinc ribbon domain-containing protein [Anaerolineaceae bacterium]